jgi:hypothetical protein
MNKLALAGAALFLSISAQAMQEEVTATNVETAALNATQTSEQETADKAKKKQEVAQEAATTAAPQSTEAAA